MTKSDILLGANFRYNFDRDLWVDPKAKKAFSIEFVDDHREELIFEKIGENTADNGWTFYFNFPPSEGVRHELERVLG